VCPAPTSAARRLANDRPPNRLINRVVGPYKLTRGAILPEQRAVVIGVSGASGAPIAVRVLETLASAGVPVALVVSNGARAVLKEESGLEPSALSQFATHTFDDHDLAASIASGSVPTRGMAVVPASMNTVAKIALGLGDSLLLRAAQVHLKERRPLVVVPRETPISAIHLRHLATLAELGVVVLPASPPYYTHPKTVQDQTDYLAGKVLDQFGVPHTLFRGWKGGVV
jgi:polyprenyl P-hydroxybenzoate/phenylacrylic acid decarboxylase-like protein